jgi:hypothetical protein
VALTYSKTTQAIAQNFIVPRVADGLYDTHAVYSMLMRQGAVTYGYALKYQFPIIQKKVGSAGWFTGLENLDTDYTDNQATAAEFSMKGYYVNVSIPLMTQILFDGDPASAVRGTRLEADNARLTLADDLGSGLWNTGTAAAQPEGLSALLQSTGTYGGIAASDFSNWAASMDTTTYASATTGYISIYQKKFVDLWIGDDAPTMAVTTKMVYKYLMVNPTATQYWTDDSQRKANMGFPVLEINGRPIYVDSKCPGTSATADQYFAWLNTRWMWLGLHRSMKDNGLLMEDIGSAEKQAARIYRLYWIGCLICNNRRMQGGFSALYA